MMSSVSATSGNVPSNTAAAQSTSDSSNVKSKEYYVKVPK